MDSLVPCQPQSPKAGSEGEGEPKNDSALQRCDAPLFSHSRHLVLTLGTRSSRADPNPHARPQAKLQHLPPEKKLSYLTPGRQKCGHSMYPIWQCGDSGCPRCNLSMDTSSLGRSRCLLEVSETLEGKSTNQEAQGSIQYKNRITNRRSVPDDSDKAGRCGNPTLPVGAQWKDPEPAARLGVLTH